jgi:hypothetical protein
MDYIECIKNVETLLFIEPKNGSKTVFMRALKLITFKTAKV